ncbi:unnamed protein product [Echinostoma caproni]|uniref:Uncharacterized protein n=1 Tax=Echinostoma caproni TaxID=27848 RepID=A0A183BBE0_9TREM|nr:unnamed protein product [Echinostoma caproni]
MIVNTQLEELDMINARFKQRLTGFDFASSEQNTIKSVTINTTTSPDAPRLVVSQSTEATHRSTESSGVQQQIAESNPRLPPQSPRAKSPGEISRPGKGARSQLTGTNELVQSDSSFISFQASNSAALNEDKQQGNYS